MAETHGNLAHNSRSTSFQGSVAFHGDTQAQLTAANSTEAHPGGYQRGYQARSGARLRAPDEEVSFRLCKAGREPWVLELLASAGFGLFDEGEDELWACGPTGLVRELLARDL
jgi:hypothetical protein